MVYIDLGPVQAVIVVFVTVTLTGRLSYTRAVGEAVAGVGSSVRTADLLDGLSVGGHWASTATTRARVIYLYVAGEGNRHRCRGVGSY